MSLQPEVLGSLFDMSRDPVIGIDAQRVIVFANPAAAQLGAQEGLSAADLLPEHILSDPAEQFIATLRLGARRANVSVRRLEDVTVCTFWLLDDRAPGSGQVRALRDMSSNLMTARLAMDVITARLKDDADGSLQDAVCTLYRQYYLLRRDCGHLSQVCAIREDALPYQPRAVDLRVLCLELCRTVSTLVESVGISVVFKADMTMHLTMGDRDLLEQMLAGLLTNSIAHCKRGDVIQVELTRQGERFIISVTDPGTGMTPETLSRIFSGDGAGTAADTTAGAGLGLQVARGIAERHGGAMVLESRPGRGTAVRVSIPYHRSESTTISTPMARYRSDGMNIVLTELAPLLDKKLFNRKMFD